MSAGSTNPAAGVFAPSDGAVMGPSTVTSWKWTRSIAVHERAAAAAAICGDETTIPELPFAPPAAPELEPSHLACCRFRDTQFLSRVKRAPDRGKAFLCILAKELCPQAFDIRGGTNLGVALRPQMTLTFHRHVETSDMSGSALRPPVTGSVVQRATTARFSMSISFLDHRCRAPHKSRP